MVVQSRVVTDDEADIRLDRWVRRHFPGVPQSVIQKLCRTGKIRIDGQRADTAARLAPGQAVLGPPLADIAPASKPAPEMTPAEISDLQRLVLYRDEHVLVLNKPYGLPVQGGPGIKRHLDGMREVLRCDGEPRPRLVHRLDRDTTGALLLARTPGVAAKLAALFRGRDVD